jgi:hypothetical protein
MFITPLHQKFTTCEGESSYSTASEATGCYTQLFALIFNPHPANIRTNPEPGTFPSRRAAVAIDNCNDFHIVNMTLQTNCLWSSGRVVDYR